MKLNLFNTQENDFKVLLKEFGTTIKVNNVDVRAVVTNTSLSELDDKHISTITKIKRGDHVQFNGKDYFVINQVTTKRYESYKAIIRCAEHYIRFNLSTYVDGAYTKYDVKEVPCIVQTTSDLGLDFGKQMILAEGELAIFVQDNTTTRAIYSTFTDKQRKHDIVIDDFQYEYIGFDFINKGLVRINVKVTETGNIDDVISWTYASHHDWDGFIDKSFYTNEFD